jgi:aminoglycoside 6'-N-acetyltransferase I
MVKIVHITQDNAELLTRYDPEIFDAQIVPDRLAIFLAQPNHFMALAMAQTYAVGQIRAMVLHSPDTAPVFFIENLGVAPDYLRQGIATRLMQSALDWGRAQGCAEAWVATERENHAALALYRRFECAPMQEVAYFDLAI